ncbi:SEC-C metal-binding domain-containing protein [Carnobacterium antarcticum]|uniref:SEC-C metal-binding domain-containing protein n=1 Tax=Carnobacterium antarcticum TaxID=2126436 RepID=A0ABW4NMI9_9LACT|nr:SEC-C metal-binding domain-containing protein [Carnobacterium sp. CP1]ALV21074.1 hypothetical protein NY10_454 [Carnobacterium sp. CP1]
MFPSVCDSCGNIFSTNIIGMSGAGSATIVMKGNKTNCPKCGNMARILDGTYEMVNNIINIISSPQRQFEELKTFSEILKEAQKNGFSVDEIAIKTKKQTPGLSSLVDLLPKSRDEKRSDIQFWINIILTIILFILPRMLDGEVTGTQNINTEQIINTTINNYYDNNEESIKPIEPVRNQPTIKNKIGRNEKCPCGSGIKYKKCHSK